MLPAVWCGEHCEQMNPLRSRNICIPFEHAHWGDTEVLSARPSLAGSALRTFLALAHTRPCLCSSRSASMRCCLSCLYSLIAHASTGHHACLCFRAASSFLHRSSLSGLCTTLLYTSMHFMPCMSLPVTCSPLCAASTQLSTRPTHSRNPCRWSYAPLVSP